MKIPYAGFDNAEDDFDELEPARRSGIDVARARSLRRGGLTWAECGQVLAIEAGRRMPFQGRSVSTALRIAAARKAASCAR